MNNISSFFFFFICIVIAIILAVPVTTTVLAKPIPADTQAKITLFRSQLIVDGAILKNKIVNTNLSYMTNPEFGNFVKEFMTYRGKVMAYGGQFSWIALYEIEDAFVDKIKESKDTFPLTEQLEAAITIKAIEGFRNKIDPGITPDGAIATRIMKEPDAGVGVDSNSRTWT